MSISTEKAGEETLSAPLSFSQEEDEIKTHRVLPGNGRDNNFQSMVLFVVVVDIIR